MNKKFVVVKSDDYSQQIDSSQKQNNEVIVADVAEKFLNNHWMHKQQIVKMAARTRIELVFPG